MDKRVCAVGLTLLMSTYTSTPVFGCGDKFLVASRGTRFQRAPLARDHAIILVYAQPASDMAQGLSGVPLDATLRKAGYRPTIVESAAELDRALSHGGWDLVVLGLSDARMLAQRSKDLDVLPVTANATAADLKEARKVFPVVLRGPAKSQALLAAVDEALAFGAKAHQKSKTVV